MAASISTVAVAKGLGFRGVEDSGLGHLRVPGLGTFRVQGSGFGA